MADLFRIKSGKESSITTEGTLTPALSVGTLYVAVDSDSNKAKIYYDAPPSLNDGKVGKRFVVGSDIPLATQVDSGLMGNEDKIKLDNIEPNANAFVLPDRLGMVAKQISDWNDATANGWYESIANNNGPYLSGEDMDIMGITPPQVEAYSIPHKAFGQVIGYDSANLVQRVYLYDELSLSSPYGELPCYERQRITNSWSSWVLKNRPDVFEAGENISIERKNDGKTYINAQFPNSEIDGSGLMTPADKKSLVNFVKGTQTSATSSFVGASSNIKEVYDGLTINYWLPVASTSTAATLNLTLEDGDSTGAVPIYYSGSTRLTTHYGAGSMIKMTYMSSGYSGDRGWWCDADYNTDTIDRIRVNNSTVKASSAITAGNIIVGKNKAYEHLKNGNAFDITYPILYAGSNIAANATGTNNYAAIPFTISTTQSITLTAQLPVYIKGQISGTTFTPINKTPLTQTIPSSDDGYVYLLLGTAGSTTNVYLLPEHPIYWFKNGVFGPYNGVSDKAAALTTTASFTTNLGSTASASYDGTQSIVNPGVSGTLPIANGGTGATTAAGARANLGTMGSVKANGYEGLARMDGNTSDWIRTTTNGIIPYSSNSNGMSHLGTSSWPFLDAHVKTVHGALDGNAATATKLKDAKTITLSGDITGSVQTDFSSSEATIAATIPSLAASKLTGTIDIARLPAAVMERITVVADEAKMLELTVDDVQLGDVVKINDFTKKMYMVKDTSKLAVKNANGTIKTKGTTAAFEEFSVGTAASALADENGNNIVNTYLKLAGGTMTGALTVLGNKYEDSLTNGALHMNNSNIDGLNSIYMADKSDNSQEGIHFYRDASHTDTLWIKDGEFRISKNRALGGTAAGDLILDSSNYSDYAVAKSGSTMTGALIMSTEAMPLSAGKVSNLTAGTSKLFKDALAISNPATANDVGWMRVLGTGESDTVLEIATGDDGGTGEMIVARQYNTSNAVAHEARILDHDGNTELPGSVKVGGGVKLVYNSTNKCLDFIF